MYRRKPIMSAIKIFYLSLVKENIPIYGVVSLGCSHLMFTEAEVIVRIYDQRERCAEGDNSHAPGASQAF